MATDTSRSRTGKGNRTTTPKRTSPRPRRAAPAHGEDRAQAAQARDRVAVAAEMTTEAARETQRNLRGLFVDSAYASLGASQKAIELLRSVDRSVDRVRVEAPKRLLALPKQAPEAMRAIRDQSIVNARNLRGQAGQEFEDLARRGRELVESITGSPTTREATTQLRTARRQVRAATTGVRKAAADSERAAEQAADIVIGATQPEAEHA